MFTKKTTDKRFTYDDNARNNYVSWRQITCECDDMMHWNWLHDVPYRDNNSNRKFKLNMHSHVHRASNSKSSTNLYLELKLLLNIYVPCITITHLKFTCRCLGKENVKSIQCAREYVCIRRRSFQLVQSIRFSWIYIMSHECGIRTQAPSLYLCAWHATHIIVLSSRMLSCHRHRIFFLFVQKYWVSVCVV